MIKATAFSGGSFTIERTDNASTGIARNGGVADTNPRIIAMVFTGTQVTVRVSGIVVINDALDVGECSFNQFTIGVLRRHTIAGPLNGRMGRIAAWTRALDEDDIAIAEARCAE